MTPPRLASHETAHDRRQHPLRRHSLALCLGLLGMALPACGARPTGDAVSPDATLDRTVAPPPGRPRPWQLPDTRTVVLENGLEVVLVPRGTFPTLSMRLSIRAGYDAAPTPAIAELTSRTVREGTASMGSAEIARFAAGRGITWSASTTDTATLLSVDGLSTNADDLLHLLAELAVRPTFPADRVEARRDEAIEGLQQQRSRSAFHAQRLTRRVVFGMDGYGRSLERDDLAAVDRDAVVAHHAARWRPNRAQLVVTGAIPDGIEDQIRAHLGGWESGEAWTPPTVPTRQNLCNDAYVVPRANSAQTSVTWIGLGHSRHDPGYFDALVTHQILGGGAPSRLFQHLREEKSYTYGAYSRMSEIAGAAWWTASADVRSEVTEEALDAFRSEFDRLRAEPAEGEELQGAQDYLAGVLPIRVERNAQLAGQIVSTLEIGLSVEWLSTWRERVREVTAEATHAHGAALLDPSGITLVLVGEESVVRAAARAHAGRVHVIDLDGQWVETFDGALASTCAGAAGAFVAASAVPAED
jgi:zinc protease